MDDHQLVAECLKHRPAAQRMLYDRFAGPMLGVCYRYTKSMGDAEDVLQEGFVKVYRYLSQYKGSGELGAWIRRIMVTTALNYLKKHVRYQSELAFESDHLHPVSTDDPQVSLQAKELAELIRQLPVGYQTIFNLHAVEGYTHVEIGQMLGIHEGTSRSQYARARALLITWIEKKMLDHKPGSYARSGI
ncbi:RNA polymerase sigma-70 factor, ECF subfamily [Cnuella takakiae]|uniref:RNA polymerase sigma-70 factor, ECF subfamily n=1 Tax=Cnuella takakiae TaxID=1302690 RepID=A0A1M4XVZ5_9BACT|nr:sigma-70 family RNA polymerase sigma factor [Cnuella takakiae]OLY92959.1 RNA polymerase subunit sigma-70 [Cnuella takakiae]SHE97516.1 RNA polymerase sigma-70 factor, ECF subfamily [Cnuella takakiae]